MAEQGCDFRVAPFNLSYVLQSKLSVVLQNRTRGVRFQVRLYERDVVDSVCVQTVCSEQSSILVQETSVAAILCHRSRDPGSLFRVGSRSPGNSPPSGKGVVNEIVKVRVGPSHDRVHHTLNRFVLTFFSGGNEGNLRQLHQAATVTAALLTVVERSPMLRWAV